MTADIQSEIRHPEYFSSATAVAGFVASHLSTSTRLAQSDQQILSGRPPAEVRSCQVTWSPTCLPSGHPDQRPALITPLRLPLTAGRRPATTFSRPWHHQDVQLPALKAAKMIRPQAAGLSAPVSACRVCSPPSSGAVGGAAASIPRLRRSTLGRRR